MADDRKARRYDFKLNDILAKLDEINERLVGLEVRQITAGRVTLEGTILEGVPSDQFRQRIKARYGPASS